MRRQLSYSLPEFGITMPFAPTEFTQVNSDMNRLMVSRAMRLLDPQAGERIADFFCGLGNFTLPIARSGAQVLGVEGSDALVKRARQNAEYNGLSGNTEFQMMNLFEMDEATLAKSGRFDKWLVDPPRDGAIELMKSISEATASPSHRLRLLQSVHAGARRRSAGACEGLCAESGGRDEHVPADFACGVDRGVRKVVRKTVCIWR